MKFEENEKLPLRKGESFFSDDDLVEINRLLALKLSQEAHVENIGDEIWYVDPIKGTKTILVDKNGNDINDLFDVAKVK